MALMNKDYYVKVESDDRGVLIDEVVEAKGPSEALRKSLRVHGYRAFIHKAYYSDAHSEVTGSVKSVESKRATCLHRYNIYWKHT